jgi:putative FmdB family regulatory protein
MATYRFLCPSCGPFDVVLPMGTAPPYRDCTRCDRPGRRLFTAPHLSRLAPALAGALAREERSRDEPEIVSSDLPGTRPI